MQIPLVSLVLAGFPEMIAVVLLGFTVSKAQHTWKTVVFTGIGLALAAYFIRMIPTITFGVHTVVLIAFLFFVLTKIGKAEIPDGILGSVIAFLALVVFETIGVMSILKIFNITSLVIAENQYFRVLAGIPHISLLYLCSFLLRRYRLRSRKNDFCPNK